MTYSQSGEDLIIAKYFGDFKGRLLDIGANDGITFSNSRLLIQKRWKATLIEPSLAYNKLADLYEGHHMVTTHCCAVSNYSGQATWYELTDSLLSTTNKEMAESWGSNYSVQSCQVKPVSDFKPETYDFISIDAEGEDWNILQQIDLTNVKCLCIECGNIQHLPPLYIDYCSKYGMKLLHMNGENMIFVK